MADPTGAQSKHGHTLREKFEMEKRRFSFNDFHCEDVKRRLNMSAPLSNQSQKAGNKDEIVRHMSNLPSYLETRKKTTDKVLNFGVLDWGRLQKWQYSTSSSYSSPLFSTERSIPQSPKGQSCPLAGQRSHRMTLQSHFDTYPPWLEESSASLKGKMKMHDPYYKNMDLNMGSFTASKRRSMSPVRRFSFSYIKRTGSPVSRKANTGNNTPVVNRSHSTPLRRLLEPLFPLKATTNSRQFTDLRNEMFESSSTRQANFQLTLKNGRPLFTFATENDNNILAATVRDLSKDNNNHWIYTFFSVDEIKKTSWLSSIRKDKGHGYDPHVTAQMMVTNRTIYNSDTREFSLFLLDPYDELAAIVVKFSRILEDEEENKERFSSTVILPSGKHGLSSDCKPPSLTDRWRSGGVCDCGGWDLGCRIRTLTNQVQSSGRSNSPRGQFQLHLQGDVMNKNHLFSLCPSKEGIFSVEYDSSVSPLQAFSICISVAECRKSSQQQESMTYDANKVKTNLNPVCFASFPPPSPVGRV